MARYSTNDDVKLHAPQAEPAFDFTPYIDVADRVINAQLKGQFDVPFDPVPELLIDISAKMAAGRYLKVYYSRVKGEVPDFVEEMLKEAMTSLMEIVQQPSLLGVELRDVTPDDIERDRVEVSNQPGGAYPSNDPRDWG